MDFAGFDSMTAKLPKRPSLVIKGAGGPHREGYAVWLSCKCEKAEAKKARREKKIGGLGVILLVEGRN